jgi:hypothetical protein
VRVLGAIAALLSATCGLFDDTDPTPAEVEAEALALRDRVEQSIAAAIEATASGTATGAAAGTAAGSAAGTGAGAGAGAKLRDPAVLLSLAERAEERLAAGDREEAVVLLNTLVHASLNASVALLSESVELIKAKNADAAEERLASAKQLQSAADALLERRNVAFIAMKSGYADAKEPGRRAIVLAAWRVGIACEIETAAAKFVLGLPATGDSERVMALRNAAVNDLTARGTRADAAARAARAAAAASAAPGTATFAPATATPGPATATAAPAPAPATATGAPAP